MMRGKEIVEGISWSGDVHPETIKQIQDAIEALDRKAYGTNRPQYNALEVHKRLTSFISEHGCIRKAADAIGISKSYLHDVDAGHRPASDGILRHLGLQKSTREIFTPID